MASASKVFSLCHSDAYAFTGPLRLLSGNASVCVHSKPGPLLAVLRQEIYRIGGKESVLNAAPALFFKLGCNSEL